MTAASWLRRTLRIYWGAATWFCHERLKRAEACAAIQGINGCSLVGQAMQEAGIGILSWDISRDQVRITGAGKVMHGLGSCGVMSSRDWLMLLRSDEREIVRLAIQRARNEKTNFQIEYRVMHQGGSERWIAMQGREYPDGAGGQEGLVIGVLSDVTLRWRMKQELKEQHRVLAHMGRTAVMGELSAALAHELSQPLAAMLCNAQAGQRFLGRTSPDLHEVRSILADIATDNQRAGAVVSRLRELFRQEEAISRPLSINTLVEDVIQILRGELVMKQVFLFLHLASGLPEVRGDPVQLRQVLLNLIMNSVEAMSASVAGIRELRICTDFRENGLEVAIRDTGPGIAPQLRESIFEPFVTDKANGMGMGLSISRNIIASHGGRLWADNLPEGGAILRITLPVLQEVQR